MKNKIAIIGAGAIGSAVASVVCDPKTEVSFWDIDEKKLAKPISIDQAVNRAGVIFLCVPSRAVRDAATRVAPHAQKGSVIVSLAKGIEAGSELFMDEVLQETLPGAVGTALLGGPMLAAEIAAGMPAAAVLGSQELAHAKKVADLFQNTKLCFACTTDVRGVAVAGVLKNIYALALGMGHALGWGENQKGWLLSRAADEMVRAGALLGGTQETMLGLAGLGDLVATGFSPHSHNRKTGIAFVEKPSEVQKAESLNALPIVIKKLGVHASEFPLLMSLQRIIKHECSPQELLDTCLRA